MNWIQDMNRCVGPAPWDKGDNLPTMAEEAETKLQAMRCQCGNPTRAGWMHIYWRSDMACYRVEANPEDTND